MDGAHDAWLAAALAQALVAFVGGLGLWTLLEYVLHRFAFHRRMLGRAIAREHLQHHAEVDYFVAFSKKLALAAPILAALALPLSLAVGAVVGVSVPAGVVVGWLVYERIHRRIHVAPPRNAYERWARRHHLLHHFGRADSNHGVSVPLWDHVFRTHVDDQQVTIPRRHVEKFPWLLAPGTTDTIADAYAADYRVR